MKQPHYISCLILLLFCLVFTGDAFAADAQIVVHKSKRVLEVIKDKKLLHTFRIGLGFSPKGTKQREGDGKTPDGTYYVCVKNPKSSYYRSLGISYPGPEDAKRGLATGLITQAEYDQILKAAANKQTPPWKTKLGGEIFIHGHGSHRDWTWGCIALDDQDMKTLYELAEKGIQVTIRP